jgi:hypothetical protein
VGFFVTFFTYRKKVRQVKEKCAMNPLAYQDYEQQGDSSLASALARAGRSSSSGLTGGMTFVLFVV